MNNQVSDKDVPLVVDLDGTLINTDLLYEAAVLLFKKNPLYIFNCVLWLLKGKAFLKNEIFKRVQLQYQLLPYNTEVINFLQQEFAVGRKIILATASPLSCAVEIAKVQPFFSQVYGTVNNTNLKGANKLNLLVKEFGESKFDYIGNAKPDLIIFVSCRYAYLVNATGAVERSVKKLNNLKNIWGTNNATFKDYIKAIRAYQWIKNLLLFVPLVTSHSLQSVNLLTISFFAFLAFNLVASAGYLLNDLLDIGSDRRHPRKQFRPVASGKVSVTNALIIAILFLAAGLIFAATLNIFFFAVLLFYFFTSSPTHYFLKK